MLLNKTVFKVLLLFIRVISLSYLVNWFLSLSSGDDKDIFTIEESMRISKRFSIHSLPNLQLFSTSYWTEAKECKLVGFIKLLLRLTCSKEWLSSNSFKCTRQLWVRLKWVKFRHFVANWPSIILFFITKVFKNSSQLLLLTAILRSLHLALKIFIKISSNWVAISYFLKATFVVWKDLFLFLPVVFDWKVVLPIWVLIRAIESLFFWRLLSVFAQLRSELIFSRCLFIIILLGSIQICQTLKL